MHVTPKVAIGNQYSIKIILHYIYIYIKIYIYIYVPLPNPMPPPGSADGPSPLLVAPDVGQANATGLGPWVLHGLGLSPRSLRGGLCSVPKGRKAIATGVPQRGPGKGGQVQRGPGGLFRWRGTAEGSNTLFVSILVELMFFAGFPFHVIFPVAYSLQPAA